jgi:hypothetical protein
MTARYPQTEFRMTVDTGKERWSDLALSFNLPKLVDGFEPPTG